jgi:two-component system chemotaxis sensor kinase CheA
MEITVDKKEADFLAKLQATFRVEADEHLQNISDGLLALEGQLTDAERIEHVESIFRESHSLKGAARSVNHMALQEICQSMENVLSAWKQRKIEGSRTIFDTLHAVLDFLTILVAKPPQMLQGEEAKVQQELIQKLNAALEEPKLVVQTKKFEKEVEKKDVETVSQVISKPIFETENAQTTILMPFRDKTIRISIYKIDKLFQQVEEMLVVKMTAKQQVSELLEMETSLKRWEKEWIRLTADLKGLVLDDRVLKIIQWQNRFSRSVKEKLRRLTKVTTQDYRFVGALVENLLEDTKKVLMQPFSTLFETFPRMIRDLSHSLGKETRVNFIGSEIEVDRRILEEMKDPLTHLIRNSIDHGLETPSERIKKNKPSYGTITIAASQVSGNKVQLIISDDGKGIDKTKVKQAALKQGYISQQEIDKLTEQETLMLIFQSGISTSRSVTELSGRGLGMSIVSEKVDKLGGKLQIDTSEDKGTSFRILLPLTLATFRGIHVTVSGCDFIMPTHYVQMVLRVPVKEIRTFENRTTITMNGKFYAFAYLGTILNLASKKQLSENDQVYVLVIKASEKLVAIGVDNILNEQEVLVKGLGKQLVHVRNILAATIMEWGKVIPILNPLDLVKVVIKPLAN